MTISTTDVTGEYVMDPQAEDLIWTEDLREGMVVLIASETIRTPLTSTGRLADRLWCRVTQLHDEGSSVDFIGVYGDGFKFVRHFGKVHAWYVKRDSMETT